jgi:hypothetical protein
MRLYNGCPDSAFQAVLDRKAAARRRLERANPKARCVYYPMEGRYQCWVDLQQVGIFSEDDIVAIDSAIEEIHGAYTGAE